MQFNWWGYSLEISLGYCLEILDSDLTLEIAKKLCKNKAIVIIDGKPYIGVKDIANKLSITSSCVSSRLLRGWSMEDIINTPQNTNLGKKREVQYKGESYSSLLEFSEAFNLNYRRVVSQYESNKSLDFIITNCKVNNK